MNRFALLGALLLVSAARPQDGDPLKQAESILNGVGSSAAGNLKVGTLGPAAPPAPAVAGTWSHKDADGFVISLSLQEGGTMSANFAGSSREGTWKAAGTTVTIAIAAKGPRPNIDIEFAVTGNSMKAVEYTVGGKPSYNKGRVFTKE